MRPENNKPGDHFRDRLDQSNFVFAARISARLFCLRFQPSAQGLEISRAVFQGLI
jgi:hypothetical protein